MVILYLIQQLPLITEFYLKIYDKIICIEVKIAYRNYLQTNSLINFNMENVCKMQSIYFRSTEFVPSKNVLWNKFR